MGPVLTVTHMDRLIVLPGRTWERFWSRSLGEGASVAQLLWTLWGSHPGWLVLNFKILYRPRIRLRAQLLKSVHLFVSSRTAACQVPLSMRFFRQEHWNGLLLPPLGDLPGPGIKPTSPASPALQADSLPLSHCGSPKDNIYQPQIGGIYHRTTVGNSESWSWIKGYGHCHQSPWGEGQGFRWRSKGSFDIQSFLFWMIFFLNIHLFGCCQALVVACRLSCPVACGILVPGPEIELCPLRCKTDS